MVAVDPARLLLADHDVLEPGQVAVAAVVERPKPDVEDELLPRGIGIAPPALALEMVARDLHRRAAGDRVEQGENLPRLRRRGLLDLGLIQAVVVEQRPAEIVAQALVVRDLDLGEQAMLGVAAGRQVDLDVTLPLVARAPGRERRNAAPGLVGVPDSLIDPGRGRQRPPGAAGGQRQKRSTRPETKQEAATIGQGSAHPRRGAGAELIGNLMTATISLTDRFAQGLLNLSG
jgi:hypothetical protein